MKKYFTVFVVFALVVCFAAVSSAAESADVKSPDKAPAYDLTYDKALENKDPAEMTPAEKLAVSQKISLQQARELLLAAGVDPDTIPATHAAKAGYDPDEVVEMNFVTVWRNDPDHIRLVNVYQGFGKFKPGDRRYLFASGQRVAPHTDVNGHSDSAAVNGHAFKGPKLGVSGLAVFSQATSFCIDKSGKTRKAWFNILVDYRQPSLKEGVEVADENLVQFVNAHGVWNCREAFDESTASYQAMTGPEWKDQEMLYAAYVNDKGGDTSFFMYYKTAPGETVDLAALHQKGLKEGLYSSYSAIWGGSDDAPAKPKFPAAQKAAPKKAAAKKGKK